MVTNQGGGGSYTWHGQAKDGHNYRYRYKIRYKDGYHRYKIKDKIQ